MRLSSLCLLVAAAAVLTACDGDDPGSAPAPRDTITPTPAQPTVPERPTQPAPTATVEPVPEPVEFDTDAAFEFIEHLADGIGPREASSDAFHEAAADVEDEFTELGYEVTQVPVPVPAGDSWGVAVPEGESANVIADPAGFEPTEAHIIIGAHLDTVPQAPGAEDNASGVAVMLELARMAAAEPPGTPVRFIAFGAEEPRGPGDDLHHFGSQQYVADMPSAEQDALVAMVSLDRVGVAADQVPICTGGTGTTSVMDALIEAADVAGVAAQTCENRASDHWSFEKADLPSARLGSVPYAGYHSPDDVPSVVDTDQLDKVGQIMWSWLAGL
ncbi:M28 family metallopeptidase [Phytoactinopolyspora mesophila]|uniref:M20/M25/M40 family metallo-hydrolase n=1 Tax=Phytoactinopolyspora mesophila TaxID=2650750 RepID=A0A7K3M3L6_9ACTN|nr:M28 family peptidase [Phytoactinopolyspora mesophila]NDL57502.1 M20/M25/M40 family metallo-hydrolase [Phytoactinopolyspora mesophila]